ncbi:MAG: FAD-dependent oxidoreductase [Candidatus Limnocylindria bacterium]
MAILTAVTLATQLAVPHALAEEGSVPVAPQPSVVTADVVVYGGTPAGIMAAIAARRTGAGSVLLIETTRHLGGMMTSGLNATDAGDPNTLGGITREFFNRMQAVEGSLQGRYNFQSRNAESVFGAMLAEAGVVVRLDTRLAETAAAVTNVDTRIDAITTTAGDVFRAGAFVDASYEGDLMARAGVSYVVGREAASQYDETYAGVRPAFVVVGDAQGVNLGFPVSGPGEVGSADSRIQASNFRICLTTTAANQVPIGQPAGYDPANYDIVATYLARRVAAGELPRLEWVLWTSPLVNDKYDANDFGAMSTGVPAANYAYPDGTYAQRAQITAWHREYNQGLLYFLRNDPRVPAAIRDKMATFGLCKDEFVDNGNWPYVLYLREGRRMVGASVLTQHDIEALRSKPDIIGIASYVLDSHLVSRYLDGAGNLMAEGWLGGARYVNYAIPYSAMTPRRSQVTNLLVAVTSAASHVAQSSLRMEPQYMLMGEAAGTAAWLAASGATAVQDVPIATLQARLSARASILGDPGDFGSSPFYADIVWAYHAGITAMCADGRFCPTAAVTREQMASFLVRALVLPPATRDYFTDDAASPHQADINRLAASGITAGCSPTTYCPAAMVTRGEMVAFLHRGLT